MKRRENVSHPLGETELRVTPRHGNKKGSIIGQQLRHSQIPVTQMSFVALRKSCLHINSINNRSSKHGISLH